MADTNTPSTSGANDTAVLDADPALSSTTADSADAKHSTTQKLKDEAAKLGSQASERARHFAGEGKERASGALEEIAKMLATAAEDVDAKLGAEYGKYARSAADGVNGFAESLRSKQVDDLIEDATAFVRKSPAIAVGTAAAVGFVLARLIKSGIEAASDAAEPEPADTTKP